MDFSGKVKPSRIATVYLPAQVKNHYKIKQFETNGYKIYKVVVLTIITYNSKKNFNPEHYENYVPKPMFPNKILELIDRNPDTFSQYACKITCRKLLCFCKTKYLVKWYLCYKMYESLLNSTKTFNVSITFVKS